MTNFKKLSIAIAITGMFASNAVLAENVTVKAAQPETKAESIETMLKIDIGDVVKDTSERSDSRRTQDLNDNKKSALQSSVELLNIQHEVSKLEYIERNVPIEVRVQGIEASLAWIDKKAKDDKTKRGTNVVWASSDENLYIPISRGQNTTQVSTGKQSSSELTAEDILKLKELGLVIPGKESQAATTTQPEKQTAKPVQTERAFISATGVNASRVVVMGDNKHFSGEIYFDISLSKGKETTVHSLNRAKVGDKFSVSAVDFIVADLKQDKVSILNLETGEVKNFNI
jgi:hypothetical protein